VLSLSRPRRAAQRCTVDRNLFVTLSRGGREIPLFDRDKFPGMGTLMSSMLFPRFDDGRIVLIHNRWWSAQGSIISPNRIDDFFLDICRRAGHEPHFRRTWLTTGRPGWDVRSLY
jgi:hypothetical protein